MFVIAQIITLTGVMFVISQNITLRGGFLFYEQNQLKKLDKTKFDLIAAKE